MTRSLLGKKKRWLDAAQFKSIMVTRPEGDEETLEVQVDSLQLASSPRRLPSLNFV